MCVCTRAHTVEAPPPHATSKGALNKPSGIITSSIEMILKNNLSLYFPVGRHGSNGICWRLRSHLADLRVSLLWEDKRNSYLWEITQELSVKFKCEYLEGAS